MKQNPAHISSLQIKKGSMFSITDGKGFHITFQNGVTISVQFGPGHCCERRTAGRFQPEEAPEEKERWESSDAEVAILLPNGKFYRMQEHNDVLGWQTAEDVAKWIEVARKL